MRKDGGEAQALRCRREAHGSREIVVAGVLSIGAPAVAGRSSSLRYPGRLAWLNDSAIPESGNFGASERKRKGANSGQVGERPQATLLSAGYGQLDQALG